MQKKVSLIMLLTSLVFLVGFRLFKKAPEVVPDDEQIRAAKQIDMSDERLKELTAKKLFEFSPQDLNDYLLLAQETYPDLPERIAHFARKAIGQPYKIYLLGEFPFELYDTDPLFCLEKSDCMVFTEHIYAMALAKDWQQFFSLLQRIRYENGEISTTMRNHTSIPQWVMNNDWLIRDITDEIAEGLTKPWHMEVDPNRELINDYGLNPEFPRIVLDTSYIPLEHVPKIAHKLENGDYVCVIRGYTEKGLWSGHVGFITVNEDGTRNFLDSAGRGVAETPIIEYSVSSMERNKEREKHNQWVDKVQKDPSLLKPKRKWLFFKEEAKKPRKRYYHYGFKFYRPHADPLKRLIEVDGPNAPIVTGPKGLLINRKDVPYKKPE